MSRSPRESVEVKVNRNVVSFTILSEVAKIDGPVRFVVGVPAGFFQVPSGDILFASVFEGDVSFV